MTLLRLSPDGERLRRIAKAHAAGELSTLDYRRIRCDVIEGFTDAAADGDLTGDATQPRWRHRAVPRPRRHARARDAAPIEAPPRPRRVWLAVGIVLLAVLLGAGLAWSKAMAAVPRDPSAATNPPPVVVHSPRPNWGV